MESYQIVAGFSDLKVLFRTRSNTTKSLQEIELWWRFENEILWIHDFNDHSQKIISAIYLPRSNTWAFYTVSGTFGDKLLRLVTKDLAPEDVALHLNYSLTLFGFRAT